MLLCLVAYPPLSAQDYVRMSERTIMGTARYVGMSGAMTAVGGDPSAARDNPAGLGLYRRSEATLTADYASDRTINTQETGPDYKRIVMLPQAAWVLSLVTNNNTGEGVLFHNFMFSFNRLHSYYRNMYGAGGAGPSLGALIATTGVDLGMPYCSDRYNIGHNLSLQERGYIHEYAFDWATNISNRWYVGLGLHIQSYALASDAVYFEAFSTLNADNVAFSNENSTYLYYSGASCNLSAGVLYRPTNWLRLGFSVQTPSLGSLNLNSYGKLIAMTDSLRKSFAPDITDRLRDFHMPLYTSTSLAFQLGSIGMIALQYDYSHQVGKEDMHSLRAGLEIVPVAGMYINAGYAYESPFINSMDRRVGLDPTLDRQDAYFQRLRRTQYASVALGYRGDYLIFQMAYQYRWQNIDLFAHENAAPYDMHTTTHRIVLTLGWHRAWP